MIFYRLFNYDQILTVYTLSILEFVSTVSIFLKHDCNKVTGTNRKGRNEGIALFHLISNETLQSLGD